MWTKNNLALQCYYYCYYYLLVLPQHANKKLGRYKLLGFTVAPRPDDYNYYYLNCVHWGTESPLQRSSRQPKEQSYCDGPARARSGVLQDLVC